MESWRLEYKLIDLAFGKFTFSAIAALLTAALVVAALWSVVEHERLLAWLTGIAIVKALHLLYLQRYKRHGHRADIEPSKWKAGLVAGAVATGLGWCSAVFLFPSSPFNPLTLLGVFVLPSTPFDPVTVLLIFILAGVTAYASVAMAFVPLAAFAFFACAWLPLAVWLFSFGEQMYVVMGLLILAYLGVMVMLSRRMHAMVCSLISVSEENRGLRTAQQDNDRRMQRFFESAPGFFYTASMTSDGKSSMPFASTGIVDLFDVAAEEVADSMSPLFALVRTEDIEHVITEREASRRNLSPFHIEFRINHRIKGVRWIELHSLPQREADGATNWHGFMQDITERRRLEESLAAREREFRTLAENFPDVVIRYDLEGRRTYVNRALAELAGSDPDEMLGKFMEDTPLVDPEAYMAELRRTVATREAALLEVAAREPGGEILWYQARFVPEFDASNNVSGVLMVAGDITERRRMEHELQRRETGFRTLAENLPVAVIRYDAEQRRRYINPAAERMLRGNIAALLGKVPGDGGVPATPEMIEHYRGKMKEVSATGESSELEFVLDALPLELREHFEVRFSPERDEDGNVCGVLAIWYDITERKRLENEMLEQASFRQTLLDAINEVGMQLMVIEEGRINYVSNLKLAQEFGYGEEEIAAGVPLMDIVHPDDRARVMDYHLRRVAGEASPNSYELGLVTKNGERREYETSVAVLPGTSPLRIISVGKDITERKRMEEELRLKESVLDQASDGVFLIDENARFVYVNEQACRALDYSREELQGMRVADIDAAYSVEDSRAVGRKTRNEGTFAFETRHRRRDGSLLPVEIQASSLVYKGKQLGLAVARDISERKHAMNALRQSEMKFRTLYDSTGDAVMLLDEHGFFDCNAAALKIFGCATQEEFCANHPADLSPALQPCGTDSAELANRHIAKAMQEGSHRFEWIHRRADNNESFPVEVLLSSMELDEKSVLQATVRDITERKAMEDALLDSERMLQEAQRIAHVGSWDVDMVNDKLTWSDEIFRIWEIDKTKFRADFAAFMETVHPEDRELVGRVYNEAVENHTLYEVEHRLLFPDGRVKYILERGEPQYDEQGKPVRFIGTSLDITERKRMEAELAARERDFRSLAENLPDNIARLDTEGRYLYINPTHERTLGVAASELIGKPLPDTHEHVKAALAQVVASGKAVDLVRQTVPVNGELQIHEVTLVPEFDATGHVVSVLGLGRNMTEFYRMQETIVAREQEFRSLAENMPDSVVRWDSEGRYTYINPTLAHALGTSLDEIAGKLPSEAFPDRRYEPLEIAIAELLAGGEGAVCVPQPVPTDDGQTLFHEVNLVVERNAVGEVTGVLGIGRDVTEHRRMQETIAAREQEFRSLAENMPNNIARWDCQGRYIYINPNLERLFGGADHVIGKTKGEAFPDGRFAEMEAIILNVVATGKKTTAPRQLVPDENGEIRLHDLTLVPEFDAAGHVVGVLGIGHDMTDIYRMQDELAAREQEFRSLAESSPDFIIRYDRDGRTRYLNTSLVRELGLGGADEVIGKRPSEIWPDGRFNSLEQAAVRAVETGEKQVIEMVSPGKNGEMSYSMISIVPERDTSGNIIGTIASGRDVTALRAMERLMQMVGDHMPGALTQYRLRPDLSGELLYASRGLKDLYGFTREDLAEGIAPMIALIHPDDLPQAVAEQEHAAKTLTTAISEFRVHHPEKGEIWVQQITTPVPETDGSMLWYSLMFDVTERKQAQQRLELLEHAIEVSSDAIYLNDDELRFSYVNEAACSALGYTREELLAMGPHDIDPGISREIAKNILESSPLGIPVGFETQHRTKDGRFFPVELHGIHFERGGRKFGLSVVRDITERKRMELLVAQERATLRTFFGAMPSLAWMKDSEGRYLACNPMFEQLYGGAEEELIGKTDFDFVDAELADFFRRKDQEAAAAGKPCVNEEWVTFASDGRRALLETVKSPVFDAEGKVVAVIGVAHDITERKRMSDALAERQAFLDSLFEAIPVPVFYKDREGRYLGFNRAYESVFGVNREQLIGKSVFDTHPRELAETYHAKDAEVFERRVALQQYEYQIKHANGTLRDVLFSKAAFTDAKGEVNGLIGAVIDITERKLTEEALRHSERLTRTVVDATPDWIFIKDQEHRYRLVNQSYADALHLAPEDFIGKNDLDLGFPEELVKGNPEKGIRGFWADDRLVLDSNETQVYPDDPATIDGEVHTFHTIKVPLRGADGKPWGVLAFARDITERKLIEDALRANEEKLSTLFALSPLGIALTDMNGRYVEFNEAFRAICGYPSDELMALDYWTLTPREYEAQEAEQLESLAKTGRYGPYEKEYRQKDGTLVPIQLNGVLINGRDGQQYIWSIVENITERKRTEELLKEKFERIVELNDYLEENARTLEEQTVELQASQEQLRDALEFSNGVINAIPDILFEMDREGRYHGIWTQKPELLAAQKAALLNKTLHEVLPRETADIALAAIREAEENGTAYGKMISIPQENGEIRWFEHSIARKLGSAPSDTRFIVLSRDVTDRHAMEVAREEALAEARRLAQLRSAFMAQMSHELRTPLNGILGYSQNLLQDDTLGEKQAVGLNVIRHSGEHLLSLINGLLDHAAIEAGKFELVPDDIELESFLGGIIGIIRVRAEQKNLAFSFEAGNDLPGVVRGDAQRLRQVLINLLANAVKFTDSGFVILRVRLAAPSRILFEIRDSGIGIAADQLESIFLPFEQVGEIQRRAGGSGLGLSISRTLVRLMGGDIRVESRPGAGSTFSFEIEIGVVQSGRAGVDAAALAEQAETRVAQATSMLPAPPRQELDALHALALRGSMRDVMRHADSLAEAEARYRPFAEQLRQLARSFQTKALLALIEQYRSREQEE